MKVAVGSTNPSKLKAVKMAFDEMFPDVICEYAPFKVSSGVSDQPKSAHETIQGAENRARSVLEMAGESYSYGVGLEGGIEKVGDLWYECGWIAIVNNQGVLGVGSSARFHISNTIVKELFEGAELADVIDRLSGKEDVRSSWGMMGIITNGCLQRADAYSHGVKFALAPFVSGPQYWDTPHQS